MSKKLYYDINVTAAEFMVWMIVGLTKLARAWYQEEICTEREKSMTHCSLQTMKLKYLDSSRC